MYLLITSHVTVHRAGCMKPRHLNFHFAVSYRPKESRRHRSYSISNLLIAKTKWVCSRLDEKIDQFFRNSFVHQNIAVNSLLKLNLWTVFVFYTKIVHTASICILSRFINRRYGKLGLSHFVVTLQQQFYSLLVRPASPQWSNKSVNATTLTV